MRVLKSASFVKLAGKLNIDDAVLLKAVEEIEAGKVDAQLGKHLIKQRIARSGSGKSGGHRSVIVYVEGDRALFLFVFSKNERSNIDAHELETLRESAKILADLPIATLLETNWIEIPYD